MMLALARRLLVACRVVPRPEVVGEIVGDFPAPTDLRPGTMQVVVDGGRAKWACTPCPCGCGERLQLSLNPTRRPRWTVTLDWLGRPTVHPSVCQRSGCLSHFWVRAGRIDWCSDTGFPERGG